MNPNEDDERENYEAHDYVSSKKLHSVHGVLSRNENEVISIEPGNIPKKKAEFNEIY